MFLKRLVYIMKRFKIFAIVVFGLLMSKSVLSQQLVSVSATQVSPRQEAGYRFVIETDQYLPADAVLTIKFPDAFLLNNCIMAVSQTLNGGLTVNVIDSNIVRVGRTGLGDLAPSGQVDIYLASIINPMDMDQDYNFEITILENSQELTSQVSAARVLPVQ